MKTSSVCLALSILLVGSFWSAVTAQVTERDRAIAEMELKIELLKTELDLMKHKSLLEPKQQLAPVAPVPSQAIAPVQSPYAGPVPSPTIPAWQNGIVPSVSPYDPRLEYDRHEFSGQDRFYNREHQPRYIPRPNYEVQPPFVRQILVPQPAPLFVEPAPCIHQSFGVNAGGGLYIGPNGWGFGIGGLQFDFQGRGHHYYRRYHRHGEDDDDD